MLKPNSFQLKHVVEPHALVGKTKRLLQSIAKNQLSWKHGYVSIYSPADEKHVRTKVLLQKLVLICTPLSWFEIKLCSLVSNQAQLKRFATSMMSFYMTSSALHIQMPSDGLWRVKQTNSTNDYVILHEKVSSV